MKFNFDFLYRKKKFDQKKLETSSLSRVLNLLDLTALGVAATLGSGVYVMIGDILVNYTGPSIIISFILAGFCSFLAGLCYAEMGARVPRSGSAYVYIYVTIGEFIAYIIGWTVLLEYVICTSAAASAMSKYIDNLANFTISNALLEAVPINIDGLAPYPDFLAFGFTLVLTLFLIIGVKESSFLNKIFVLINLLVTLFIFICAATQADISNWKLVTYPNLTYTDLSGDNVTCSETNHCGQGGFFPFGFKGVIEGTAKTFFAYVGFDVLATAGEEVLNPNKNIPLSIIFTLSIVTFCYMGVSLVISLMVPYYVFNDTSILSDTFKYVNLDWAATVTSVGAIFSLAACLYGSMFPMPRIAYSMSSDGLLFKFFSYILPRVKTPVFACLFTGLLASFFVILFDLNQLFDMASIGTLLAYSLVSFCTLILRYRPDLDLEEENENKNVNKKQTIVSFLFGHSDEPIIKRLFKPSAKEPTEATAYLVDTIVVIAGLTMFAISLLINLADITQVVVYVFVIIFGLILLVLTYIIWAQPQIQNLTTFKVPLVPFIPLISSYLNIYLMTTLNSATWIRFILWLLLGVIIYFIYGVRYSKENKKSSNIWCQCIEKDSYEIMDESIIVKTNEFNNEKKPIENEFVIVQSAESNVVNDETIQNDKN